MSFHTEVQPAACLGLTGLCFPAVSYAWTIKRSLVESRVQALWDQNMGWLLFGMTLWVSDSSVSGHTRDWFHTTFHVEVKWSLKYCIDSLGNTATVRPQDAPPKRPGDPDNTEGQKACIKHMGLFLINKICRSVAEINYIHVELRGAHVVRLNPSPWRILHVVKKVCTYCAELTMKSACTTNHATKIELTISSSDCVWIRRMWWPCQNSFLEATVDSMYG